MQTRREKPSGDGVPHRACSSFLWCRARPGPASLLTPASTSQHSLSRSHLQCGSDTSQPPRWQGDLRQARGLPCHPALGKAAHFKKRLLNPDSTTKHRLSEGKVLGEDVLGLDFTFTQKATSEAGEN